MNIMLNPAYRTELCINDNGQIAIRQARSQSNAYTDLILLTFDQAVAIHSALGEILKGEDGAFLRDYMVKRDDGDGKPSVEE